ncbi:restriction endonuclease subunit S [Bacteroides intestinalis]|uniref:restriction endonuclease subunit S n=1 Tax=Bacteroides intestinalis TaxID=329854 RepID=UPI00189D6E15|nr:restriction endonuclease subunit S [Bacteroides intestinalis]
MAENKNEKECNVPPLRFPEFTGEWKRCIIGELSIKVGSGVTPKGGESVYKTEGHPFVRSQNVGFGHLLLDDIAFIDEEMHLRQKNTELKLDDVLLNITGASIGRSALVNEQIAGGNVNQHVCIIRTKENLVSSFLCNFLLSNYGQRQIDSFQAGGNRQGLNFEQIKSIKIAIPSTKEQRKIATLLHLIDERITTQNKIIDKLQSLIKGLAVTLTTKGKPNTAISQCLECHSSTLQESKVLPNGLYKVFGANGLVGYTDVSQMNGDAILVIKDGSGVGTTSYAQGKFSVIGTLNYLTILGNYDLRYLYFALSVFNFQPYKTGMAIPHIYFKDYSNAKIYCPPLTEQKRIANVLGKLESKLLLEQELITLFNQQKQYLLGQVFI